MTPVARRFSAASVPLTRSYVLKDVASAFTRKDK